MESLSNHFRRDEQDWASKDWRWGEWLADHSLRELGRALSTSGKKSIKCS